MHHGKKVKYIASCLSTLTASVICVVVVVKVRRLCWKPKPYQTVTGFVIIAIHMFAYLVITFAQSVESYQVINHHLLEVDILVEVMLITYYKWGRPHHIPAAQFRKKNACQKMLIHFLKFYKTGWLNLAEATRKHAVVFWNEVFKVKVLFQNLCVKNESLVYGWQWFFLGCPLSLPIFVHCGDRF